MALVPGLYTTVKNTSGETVTFGFLGLRGTRLADNETMTVPGDLVAKLGGKISQRQFKAFEKAVDDGILTIISSPAVYVEEESSSSSVAPSSSSSSAAPSSSSSSAAPEPSDSSSSDSSASGG